MRRLLSRPCAHFIGSAAQHEIAADMEIQAEAKFKLQDQGPGSFKLSYTTLNL
jgi:hypothetical protein